MFMVGNMCCFVHPRDIQGRRWKKNERVKAEQRGQRKVEEAAS